MPAWRLPKMAWQLMYLWLGISVRNALFIGPSVSAMKATQAEYDLKGKLSLRDVLALERTRLANQRTLLAYLRTGLYLFFTALAVLELDALRALAYLSWIGFALGLCTWAMGLINYLLVRRRIKRGDIGKMASR